MSEKMDESYFDGLEWVGPEKPWSHIIELTGLRCDRKPVLNEMLQEYWCPHYGGHTAFTVEEAAARRIMEFTRPFDPTRDYKRVPMEGYVQIGPTTYERIATVDKDAAYTEARRAEIEYFRKERR